MKTNYQKVEGILYCHYRNKTQKQRIIKKLIRLENKKHKLKQDIKEFNIEFNTLISGIEYSKDKTSTSINIDSFMEKDIENGIERLTNQYKSTLINIINLKRRLRDM